MFPTYPLTTSSNPLDWHRYKNDLKEFPRGSFLETRSIEIDLWSCIVLNLKQRPTPRLISETLWTKHSLDLSFWMYILESLHRSMYKVPFPKQNSPSVCITETPINWKDGEMGSFFFSDTFLDRRFWRLFSLSSSLSLSFLLSSSLPFSLPSHDINSDVYWTVLVSFWIAWCNFLCLIHSYNPLASFALSWKHNLRGSDSNTIKRTLYWYSYFTRILKTKGRMSKMISSDRDLILTRSSFESLVRDISPMLVLFRIIVLLLLVDRE